MDRRDGGGEWVHSLDKAPIRAGRLSPCRHRPRRFEFCTGAISHPAWRVPGWSEDDCLKYWPVLLPCVRGSEPILFQKHPLRALSQDTYLPSPVVSQF